MTDEITWPTNKRLMASLWPKWRPTDEQARLLNDRWGLLHQDTLRKCIEDNAMQSRREPSVSAINRAYCKLTAPLVGASTSTSKAVLPSKELFFLRATQRHLVMKSTVVGTCGSSGIW